MLFPWVCSQKRIRFAELNSESLKIGANFSTAHMKKKAVDLFLHSILPPINFGPTNTEDGIQGVTLGSCHVVTPYPANLVPSCCIRVSYLHLILSNVHSGSEMRLSINSARGYIAVINVRVLRLWRIAL